MNRNVKELLHEITTRTPKQEVYEIISLLLPLEKELNITITNYYLLTHEDTPGFAPIPLDNIHLAIATETNLFLVCHNDVIHCFDRQTHRHEICFPNEEKPGCLEMFLMACGSYLERWRMRIS